MSRKSIAFERHLEKEQHRYEKMMNSSDISVEELISNHKEAVQKISNHILFRYNLEIGVSFVSDDTGIYVLMLTL